MFGQRFTGCPSGTPLIECKYDRIPARGRSEAECDDNTRPVREARVSRAEDAEVSLASLIPCRALNTRRPNLVAPDKCLLSDSTRLRTSLKIRALFHLKSSNPSALHHETSLTSER